MLRRFSLVIACIAFARVQSGTAIADPVPENLLSHIGKLFIENSANNSVSSCTATLIAPKTIITAAHCLPLDGGSVEQNFRVTFQSEFDQRFEVTSATTGKREANTFWTSEDWAIATLDETPIEIDSEIPFEIPSHSRTYTGEHIAIGYGGDDSPIARSCVRLDTQPKLGGAIITNCQLRHGDSGGPVFIKLKTGRYALVGINSGMLPESRRLAVAPILLLAGISTETSSLMVPIEKFRAKIPKPVRNQLSPPAKLARPVGSDIVDITNTDHSLRSIENTTKQTRANIAAQPERDREWANKINEVSDIQETIRSIQSRFPTSGNK